MTTLSRTVDAQVTGHRVTRDVDGVHYAAIYGFSAEGVEHQVVDQVLSARPSPREGTRVVLRYPVGRPELARVPRPLLWLAVYGALIGLFGVLLAKALGGLPD